MSDLRQRLDREASRGDVVPFELDGRPSVLLSHPRYFKHVLADAAARYGKTQKERLFGNGLLLAEGQEWATQRRDATRLLLDGAARQRAVIAATVADLIAEWRTPGPHDVSPGIERYVLRNLSNSLFGLDLGDAGTALGGAIRTLICDDPRDRAAVALLADLRHRVSLQPGLPPFFDNPDQITTFLLAGSETVSNTLAWAIYQLARTPGALEAVRLGGDAAVTAALEETMRLYPPLWIVTREVRQRDSIDGVELEPGTAVYLFVLRVQRDPRFWREPEAFLPARFEARAQEPFAFVPFGAGPRVCVGRRFAMAEMSAVIREVARQFTLAVPPGSAEPREGPYFTLRPMDPIRIAFTEIGSPVGQGAPV